MADDSSACATSASPPYFRTFVNDRTHEGFLDGALFHINPVRIAASESQLIWPDIKSRAPDILLSLGTGYDASELASALEDSKRHGMVSGDHMKSQVQPKSPRRLLSLIPRLNRWHEISDNHVRNLLNCELTWTTFCKEHDLAQPDLQSYQRLNIALTGSVPRMDEVRRLWELKSQVEEQLKEARVQAKIARIARSLIASSFYFNKEGPSPEVEGLQQCQGKQSSLSFSRRRCTTGARKKRPSNEQAHRTSLRGQFI